MPTLKRADAKPSFGTGWTNKVDALTRQTAVAYRRHSGRRLLQLLLPVILATAVVGAFSQTVPATRPLKVLLLASGGYHDYAQLAPLLDTKISRLINVKFDLDLDESLARLKNKDFARGYDVIVYDVCHVNTDSAILENAIEATRNGKPAVFIHCAIPAFRESPRLHDWENFAGERSKTHTYMGAFGAQKVFVNHPVTRQWPNDWTTAYDELYDTNELIAGSLPLLVTASPKNGSIQTVAWIQTFGKGRVFATALGHDLRTSESPAYLQLLANGLLWACDKLGEDGNPKPGYAAAK